VSTSGQAATWYSSPLSSATPGSTPVRIYTLPTDDDVQAAVDSITVDY